MYFNRSALGILRGTTIPEATPTPSKPCRYIGFFSCYGDSCAITTRVTDVKDLLLVNARQT